MYTFKQELFRYLPTFLKKTAHFKNNLITDFYRQIKDLYLNSIVLLKFKIKSLFDVKSIIPKRIVIWSVPRQV